MASITTERCNSCPFQNKGNPRKTEFSSRINSVVAGRWSLVAGRWSLVAGRWSLVAGRWSLVAGRWSLVAGRWSGSIKIPSIKIKLFQRANLTYSSDEFNSLDFAPSFIRTYIPGDGGTHVFSCREL
ncbi:YXWGXW repeat-containing protein [Escherichia coli]|nr:YXWGXW repeat-containing protein [Escherichia coli]EKM6627318.1 YXWGXW repeat-containing protein [Escherichia coli]